MGLLWADVDAFSALRQGRRPMHYASSYAVLCIMVHSATRTSGFQSLIFHCCIRDPPGECMESCGHGTRHGPRRRNAASALPETGP